MTLQEALYLKLTATALVSSLISAEVHPLFLPEDPTLPCLSYSLIAQVRVTALDGVAAPSSLVQIDCWGRTYNEAQDVADAVVITLDSFKGDLAGGFIVHECILRNRLDIYEELVKEFRVTLDFNFWHA